MYKLCKTEQSAQRQRELEQGLLKMMQQEAYENISVSKLCDQLDIPRKSFYRYFSSKDGALYALLDHTMMEFFEAGKNTGLDRYFAFWQQHKELLDVLQRNGLSGILVDRAMDLTMREKLMPLYLRNNNREMREMAMSFAVCGLLSVVIRWHSQGFKPSAEEMTKIAMSILTNPLLQ